MSLLTIGIAEGKIGSQEDVLVSYALGSCVGICLYDRKEKLGGMVHILLPHELAATGGNNDYKFADKGILALYKEMIRQGADAQRIIAKIAGGAEMFANNGQRVPVGKRNIQAVKEVLRTLQIPILSEDSGKNYGRTIRFHCRDGRLEVTSMKFKRKEI